VKEGGGGDNVSPESNSAWFLGANGVIKACYQRSPDFGVANEDIEKIIRDSFSIWKTYIKHAHRAFDPSFDIVSDAILSPRCNGSEDLTFYLGVTNRAVELAKTNYNNPIGFAARTSYDMNKGWGKGFIWIEKKHEAGYEESGYHWTGVDQLSNLMLHEVGHVMGNEHIAGTIMDENMYEVLWAPHQIDRQRELVMCTDCSFVYAGTYGEQILNSYPGDIVHSDPPADFENVYTLLTGQEGFDVGPASLEMGPSMRNVTLVLPGENHRFPITMMSDKDHAFLATWLLDGRMAFKTVANLSGMTATQGDAFKSYTAYGTLTTLQGEQLTVVIERNLAKDSLYLYGPAMHIRYFHKGHLKTLFQATKVESKTYPQN
jgi:hypothetical protein